MKKITWKTAAVGIGVVALLALAGGTGKILIDRAAAAGTADAGISPSAQVDSSPSASESTAPSASFAVPTPLPSEVAAALENPDSGEPTVTEDENGNVTIIPDWEAKAAAAHVVSGEPSANLSGSGGGSMDLKDGVYQGDHPEATPSATPVATPKPTPTPTTTPTPTPSASVSEKPQTPAATPTPTPSSTTDSSSGGAPTTPGSYDGEISADGKYEYWAMFGQWVEIGSGSYSTPGKGTHTEVGGEVVGDM